MMRPSYATSIKTNVKHRIRTTGSEHQGHNSISDSVGKILTALDFSCGKSRDFPGWEIPSKFEKLGNTGKYFIKKIYYIFVAVFFL